MDITRLKNPLKAGLITSRLSVMDDLISSPVNEIYTLASIGFTAYMNRMQLNSAKHNNDIALQYIKMKSRKDTGFEVNNTAGLIKLAARYGLI